MNTDQWLKTSLQRLRSMPREQFKSIFGEAGVMTEQRFFIGQTVCLRGSCYVHVGRVLSIEDNIYTVEWDNTARVLPYFEYSLEAFDEDFYKENEDAITDLRYYIKEVEMLERKLRLNNKLARTLKDKLKRKL